MIEQKNIGGKLNTDVSPYKVPTEDYIDALNITRDSQSEMKDDVVSNIVGNQLIPYTQPAGINKCIGSKVDSVRDRIYYFVWNSNGNHYMVYWDRSANTIVTLIRDLTDTNGVPVLKFNPSYRINNVDIINIDDTGDLMFWTDALNPPRKINVLTAINGGYTPFFLDSFLDVIKAPPTAPPRVVYINDTTVTVNNLQKKLFVFKYRFIYDDLEKSVPSSQSLMPLPILSTNPSVDQDHTKNCGIFMIFQTGLSNVKKIELWGAQSLGNEFGEFFIIDVLDKSALNIPNDDLFSYTFYNNQAYAFADPTEASQIFDYVPLSNNAQALLNGNILAYAGITENYNLLPSTDGVLATASTSDPKTYQDTEIIVTSNVRTAANGFLYIRIFIAGILSTGDDIIINNGSFSINEIVGSGDTISAILLRFSNAYVIDDSWTLIETTNNSILLSKTNGEVLNSSITNASNNSIGNNSVSCYDWNSHYQFYGVYFDENGRTNGAQGSLLGSVVTPNYNESVGFPLLPIINLQISYRPPIWAKYFQIVRTNNLSKTYSEYWISDRTEKDQMANNTGYQYAYISIANLNQFVLDNPTIGSQLTYGFTSNDRIRFIKRFNTDGTTANIYHNNDFQIQASLLNPVINGEQQEGQFLQIILPTNTDGVTFDFGGVAFANYFINIYTPALSASNNLNLYYEFGKECYPIGNWGTANAFHYGYKQNQSADLSAPATFSLTDNGDAYYRNRLIPVGNEIDYVIPQGGNLINFNTNDNGITIPVLLNSQSYIDTNYVAQNYLSGVSTSKDTNILRIVTASPYTITFNIKGSFSFKVNSVNAGCILQIRMLLYDTTNDTPQVIPLQVYSDLVAEQTYSFNFSTQVEMFNTAQANLVFAGYCLSGGVGVFPVNGVITLTQVSSISAQGVVDYNFSDYYPSKVNGNGREFIFDSNAKQQYNPVLIRNGETFEFGTNINGINRFYGTNFDQYSRDFGAIKKMFVEDRNLFIFQEFDTGIVTILQQMVQDTADNPLSAQSTNIINKIIYPYKGKYGIGNLPESFAYFNYAKYFVDPNKGCVIRISQDGIISISQDKQMNAYFVGQLKAYQANLNNGNAASGQPYLGNPTVYGCFDFYTNKYIIALEPINRYDGTGNPTFSQAGATITFNEVRDDMEGFESFVSFLPEYMVSIGTLLCSFKNGQLWTHDNTTLMSNFYGVQYPAYITLVFNKDVELKKKFLAVSYQGNTFWTSPTNGNITTSMVNPQTGLFQQSQLLSVDYEINEGLYYAALWRDSNSGLDPVIALLEGDFLNGNWIAIKFTYTGNNSAYILMPYVDSIPSGRNG